LDLNASALGGKGVALAAIAATAFVLIVVGRAATGYPGIDEALYGLPSLNLATTGSTGTPIVEPSGHPTMPTSPGTLRGLREHTYWILPVNFLAQAAWFKLFGFSLFKERLVSAAFAVLLLSSFFALLRKLSFGVPIAVLALALIAFDPQFVARAAYGRMDMMNAAFGFAGITVYLCLREQSLNWALLGGAAFVALAGFAHPNGGLVSILGLAALALTLDLRRLRWHHLFVAGAPFVASALMLAPFAMQDRAAFVEQLRCNAAGRLGAFAAPLTILPHEVNRYLVAYGMNPAVGGASRVKFAILAAYVLAIVVLLLDRELRQRSRVLLLLFATYFVALALFENFKWDFYLIYTTPLLGAMTAVALSALARNRPREAWLIAAAILLIDCAVTVRQIRTNDYRNEYLPLVAIMKANTTDRSLIMGTTDLAFAYGIHDNLSDDMRLGYRSGKQADAIVMDRRYRQAFADFQQADPAIYRHIQDVLNQYIRIPAVNGDAVYLRKSPAAP
jgi:hypothetical protein